MGGVLTATSTLGHGSTFRFALQFEPAPKSAQKVRGEIGDLRGKRAFLIDDDATNCFILRETFQSWGMESDAFQSPEEALIHLPEVMASADPYSVAVVDRCMPGADGFEIASEIRRISASLPIVMLTSDARPGDTALRGEAGLSAYAVKPVTREQLLRIVCDAMGAPESFEPLTGVTADPQEKDPAKFARILVAEDSMDNRLLLQAYLKHSPYRLTFEENGKAAVERFSTLDFDLILMDMQMPVMDGITATRAIRTLERARGIPPVPIIALTANASSQDVQKSGNAGCDAHLSKPISKLELIRGIEKYRLRKKTDRARAGYRTL
jgi:two-component system sensor histidine kinase/response regulator